ncbi:putative RNA-directed DNA polymerase [Helianthus annuus]|nr:putative RNA-directed DNA polymerase [Helianthus annuus]
MVAETRNLMPDESEEREICKRVILEEDRLRIMDLKQKARIRWAVDGDENSAYFHGVVNANISDNRLNGLTIDGAWVNQPSLIKDYVAAFFEDKFKETRHSRPGLRCPNLSRLSVDEATTLVCPFTLLEIKNAVWDCVGDRAPGPDGINFRFLKRCWAGVEHEFTQLFAEFYQKATISKGCTSSFLALIPKCQDPGGLSEFRPISLIGCINKVIAKVLVNRLKGVIHGLISEEQTAFLSGRSILDGPLMLNEIIPWLKRSKKAGMIFKVDIEKAYDSLNWSFLESIMEQMNFPEIWRRWVMATVTTARASVLVNGSPTQEFDCHRGLRQGDPLSPFLFLFAMEALTGVIKEATRVGVYRGIQCTRHGPTLSHFLFADDVVFLGEWSMGNVLNLNRILRCFYLSSGLKVNLRKSSLYGVSVEDTEVNMMASVLRCRVGEFPFKYLGLQVGANMTLVKNWKPVVDTFKRRLSVWKANTLSYGGRLTLIKSVLNALPTYYFSLFKAPKRVLKELEKLRGDFLWATTSDRQRMPWVAWNNTKAPKEFGGTGLGSLMETNIAMLGKWWWRFKIDKNSLWRKVIWCLHQNARSWSCIPAKLSAAGPWKQVASISIELKTMGVELERCFKGVVGSGQGVAFWKDCWILDVPLCVKFPALFLLEQKKNVVVSERIKRVNGRCNLNLKWIRAPNSAEEIRELQQLSSSTSSVLLTDREDGWIWTLCPTGFFSVKNLRSHMQATAAAGVTTTFVWNRWTPLKVNFLSWRLHLDRLPTKAALAKRRVNVPNTQCSLCDAPEETSDHLFADCQFAQRIWDRLSHWCRLPPCFFFEAKDVLELQVHSRGSIKWKKVLYTVIQTAIWSIWKVRNGVVFSQKRPALDSVFEEIRVLSFLWLRNRAKVLALTWNDWINFNLQSIGV